MTPAEVRDWVKYHDSCYPGFEAWLIRRPNAPAVMEQFENLLRDITLDAAKRASKEMSVAEKQPKNPSEHIRIVRAKAGTFTLAMKRIRRMARFGDIETYDCRYCRDTGWANIRLCGKLLHFERNMRREQLESEDAAVREKAERIIGNKRCAIHCCCEVGRQMASATNAAVLDPDWMVVILEAECENANQHSKA